MLIRFTAARDIREKAALSYFPDGCNPNLRCSQRYYASGELMHNETLQSCTGDGLSVLIVENEFLITMDLELMLKEGGHSVIASVGSIKDALALLDGARPDVAVLDIYLNSRLVVPVADRLTESIRRPRLYGFVPVVTRTSSYIATCRRRVLQVSAG